MLCNPGNQLASAKLTDGTFFTTHQGISKHHRQECKCNNINWVLRDERNIHTYFRLFIDVLVMSNRVECLLPVRHFSTAFHQESENDELELYLRPIVLFLRLTGIQLPQSGRNRFFFRLANVIFFAADVCMCVIVIKMILSHYWGRAEVTTMTISWALLISFTNEILFKLSGHLSLIVKAAGPEPSRLWKTIKQLSFPGLKIRQFTKSVLVVYLLVRPFELLLNFRF